MDFYYNVMLSFGNVKIVKDSGEMYSYKKNLLETEATFSKQRICHM